MNFHFYDDYLAMTQERYAKGLFVHKIFADRGGPGWVREPKKRAEKEKIAAIWHKLKGPCSTVLIRCTL